MSASDAAPLPRLGEVFFDVRGSSRSMRLSWYSDTGVAVFSIWQGGTCTGTFRLPIEDLSRMIEALERGPRGAGLPAPDAASLTSLPGGRPGPFGDASGPPFAEYATGQYIAPVTGDFHRDLGEQETDPFGSGGYRPPAPEPVYSAPPSPSFTPSAPALASPYREDPLTSPSFRDQGRSGSYRQQAPVPPAPPSPSFTPSRPVTAPALAPAPPYREDPLTSPSFRDQGRSGSYRQQDTGEHPYGDDPLGSGSYQGPAYLDHDRPDPGYPAASDGYPAGYQDGESGGYGGRRYADDPFQSNYPDQPHGGTHPYGEPDPEPHRHRGRPQRT
jgi:hypothetical protein